MSCDNVITVQDLETDKKHSTFYREVITGKAGGTGADIDSATNAVTGQTQTTLPKVLSNVGFSPAGFDFTTGGTLTERDKAIFYQADGNWYSWGGTLPKVVPPASSPASTGGIAGNAWNVSTSAFMYRDWEGFTAELLDQGGVPDNGQPDELGDSKRVEALKNMFDPSSGSRSFKYFGATGLGIADDYAALQAAIDWAGASPNRRVFGRVGDKYRISSGLVLKWDGKFLDETSKAILDFTGTTLVPDANNMVALKVSRNYAIVIRPSVSNDLAKSGVTAYALAPENEAQTTTKVSQMFCIFHEPSATGCSVGFRFKPGPTVLGSDSGSFYHTIYSPRFHSCDRGFHFARCETGSNLTTRVDIFSPRHVFGHCAWDIEAADSLAVYGGGAEFISNAGIHAGNPTIKIHKPVPSDALSSSNVSFLRYFGEAGTTPFDFAMETEQVSMTGCTFFAYTNEGVNNEYALQNMLQNEGAIVSRAKYSSDSTPMLSVRRDAGSNQGQAYLRYINQVSYPAELYADRGFTFASPIDVARIADLQNTASNSQVIGSSLARVAISGDATTGTAVLYNTSGLAGRAIEFGGVFSFGPNGDNSVSCGTPSKRVSVYYGSSGSINTSDGREKTEILTIDDNILDAWGEVNHVTFKWIESVARKGNDSRSHFGVIAQQIKEAFDSKGIDGTKYGLLCYDKWEDQWEPIFEKRTFDVEMERFDESENKLIKYTSQEVRDVDTGEKKLVLAAGERWGIRADQCAFIEAAYQRRRCDRIEARLSELESMQR